MPAWTDRVSNENVAWIEKTDKRCDETVIFAHGRRCDGDFSVEGLNTTLNFYIRDEALFIFNATPKYRPFELLANDQLQPYEVYNTDTSRPVPNYALNKAAGRHVHPVDTGLSYASLEQIVAKPESGFAIASIRNRKMNFSQQSLATVVAAGHARGYRTFHLFFCRATRDGRDIRGGFPPQMRSSGAVTRFM